jgi:RHS repeat-associated protein
MFEVVLDYDEGHVTDETTDAEGRHFLHAGVDPTKPWGHRGDAFSAYRAGFEVRTARLCHRVLMFHHFAGEADVGHGCLVRSTDFTYAQEPDPTGNPSPSYTFLQSVRHCGYRRAGNAYLQRCLPPLEFDYTLPAVQGTVDVVDAESLRNLPAGAQGSTYQWIDLHGEGTPGLLTEQADAWFYKRNLSPLGDGDVAFSPLELVMSRPPKALDQAQFMDLAADGHTDFVILDGSPPGVYKHDDAESWEPFRPFTSRLNRTFGDQNLRLVDLDGDGRPDVLITEDDALLWHPSLGEDGFGLVRRSPQSLDEERGPRLSFADGTQSIYLADLSGDGLSDLVRVRNGEVCYWPNLGYGRFGPKVTMDASPYFDNPDQYDPKRLRLADIDGTGTTDLIYLHRDGIRLYFNQSGNAWSSPHTLPVFPGIDDVATITATDLLGNGTTCLLWSSPLPSDARRPLRYVRLMGDHKPHLLITITNNLGAETRVRYTPSTRFYLQDKRDGRPWITRLPFPVHVVERVETYDHVSRNRFVSRYAYHHGYFDGQEREFRGFGMVEQWDTEAIGAVSAAPPPDPDVDAASLVPPLLTRTWFHTGVYLGRDRITAYFARSPQGTGEGEYYREPGWTDADANQHLLPDTVLPLGLTVDEEREACRALKGSMLRQEVYGLDGTPAAAHPYLVIEQNFTVERLQPRAANRHGVFYTHPRESVGYHYERNPDDPRVSHAMTLEVDAFGNVLRSLAVGYRRRAGRSPLQGEDKTKQEQLLVTYTETDYTDNDPTVPADWVGAYRTPLACETRTYQVTGVSPAAGDIRLVLDDLAAEGFAALTGLPLVPYELPADPATPARRLIERARTLYRRNDLTGLLPLAWHGSLGLPGESYKLAFTPGLLDGVYRRTDETLLSTPADVLGGEGTDQGGYVDLDGDGHWWIPSGRVFYSPDPGDDADAELTRARQYFFLVNRHRDPLGQTTVISYDADDAQPQTNNNLLLVKTEDAVGNVVMAVNDYRVLQPRQLTDPNGNRSEVAFDTLGMVVGTAVMGKPTPAPTEGDSFDTFTSDLSPQAAAAYFAAADPRQLAIGHLGTATTRIVYDLDQVPTCAATILRETHQSDLAPGTQTTVHLSFSYSDGFGREIQKKLQAEPGPVPRRSADGTIVVGPDGRPDMVDGGGAPRWVGSGWTIYNSKGKPIRKFEPFFSDTHALDADTRIGVCPWLFYDPIQRVVATLYPNHAYEKVVFDPWQQATYDVNDTVVGAEGSTDPLQDPDVAGFLVRLPASEFSPTWYERRIAMAAGEPERVAAEKAAIHRQTPSVAHLDVLARPFLTIAQNRFLRAGVEVNESYPTRVELDIQGNQRAVRDAIVQDGDNRGRLVMRYDYDLLGNRLLQSSMEAGDHWTLNDASGKPIRIWDSRGFTRRITYDQLRRPTGLFVSENGAERLAERSVYGESQGAARNHRTRVYQSFDAAGILTNVAFDFKGNIGESRRDLLSDYRHAVDWQTNPTTDDGRYSITTSHDALNRPRTVTTPDGSVYRPTFNEANLLNAVDLNLRGAQQGGQPIWTPFLTNIDYDAKGQRTRVDYGNGASTTYHYDPETFHLTQLHSTRPGNTDGTAPRLFVDPTVIQDLHYTYDPAGNITSIDDAALKTIFFDNQQVVPRASYTYDATYRLIEAAGREHVGQTTHAVVPADGNRRDHDFSGLADFTAHPNDLNAMRSYTEHYEYDGVGNVLTLRHSANGGSWTRTYHYTATSLLEPTRQSNRLTKTTIGNGATSSETYSYTDAQGHDVNGCLTASNAMEMLWDFKDQLHQVDLGGGGTAYYVYDASGQRVRKVVDSQIDVRREERIYVGGYEVCRSFGVNALTRETVHVMDDQQRVALIETQSTPATEVPLVRYQLGNQLSSAVLELDDTAGLISYEEYHPYGTTAFQAGRSAAEVSLKRYRSTAKERDEETGFIYHGARYYAPWLGRWISCDPSGIESGLNLYIYGSANPVRFVDPTGNSAKDAVGGCYVAIVDSVFMIKKSRFDLEERSEAFQEAYARCDWASAVHNSEIAKETRKNLASNKAASAVISSALGLFSVVHPSAPSRGDEAPDPEYYSMFRFASTNATAIVQGMGMLRSISSMPRPPGPSTPALVSGSTGPRTSALTAAAVTSAEIPTVFAMSSTPTKPPAGRSDKPRTGEEVGQLHPKSGFEILDVMVDEGNKVDVLVEAAKPSRQGKLTKRFLNNPGTHDPSRRLPDDPRQPYNPTKTVMPPNQVELFRQSVEFEGKRYAVDAAGNIHQFQPNAENVFHWAGAENAKTASGAARPFAIPPGVRRLLMRQ